MHGMFFCFSVAAGHLPSEVVGVQQHMGLVTQRLAQVLLIQRLYVLVLMGEAHLSQPRIKNDGLCFDITDEIVVNVNVPFLVIVHGIAFADLNLLN